MKRRSILLTILAASLLTGCSMGRKNSQSSSVSNSSSFSSEQQSTSSQQESSILSEESEQSSSQEISSEESSPQDISNEESSFDDTSSEEDLSTLEESSSLDESSEDISSEELSSEEESSETISLQSIDLSSYQEDLFVGETVELTVGYTPNVESIKGVYWKSNNEEIATVDDGVVTAKKEGTADILAVSTYDSNIKATCTITVKEMIISTASIDLISSFTNNSSWSTISTTDFDIQGLDVTSVKGSSVYGTDTNSIRVGASRTAGSLVFNFSGVVIQGVTVYATNYGTDSSTIKVKTSAHTSTVSKVVKSDGINTFDDFKDDLKESTSLTISSNAAQRFVLTRIDIVTASKEKIYPTSIALSGDSEVMVEKSIKLKTTITPANANQRFVTYESSNKSIATVDDSGVVTGVSTGTTTITAYALVENDQYISATYKVEVKENILDEWTILIYMCGSNLESGYDEETGEYDDSYLASSDLTEIKSVKNKPDNINIAIEAGGSSRWDHTYSSIISASKLNRFHLEKNGYVKDEQITKASMGSSSTFQSFLEWGLTTYPAKKTGVIIWNHGGGMWGCCNDELYSNEALDHAESLAAIENAFSKTKTDKLEWIGYDCCLMQCQEIAEFNSPYFNYMVASQESESGYGWDYDEWVDDLYSLKDTKTILTEICDTFIEDNGGVDGVGTYYEGDYYACDQTLSVLDLNYMSAYKDAWEAMAAQLKSKITSTNASTFRKNIIGKTKYFADVDYDYFCEFDAWHMLTILANNSTFNPGSAYIDDVKTKFKNLVIYNCVQKEAAHDAYGLSFFFVAGTGYGQSSRMTSTYTNFTNWTYISKTYGGKVSSTYSY